MLSLVGEFITLYLSVWPFLFYCCSYYGKWKRLFELMVKAIPLTFLCWAVYGLASLIPNRMVGMLVKTINNAFIIGFFLKRMFPKVHTSTVTSHVLVVITSTVLFELAVSMCIDFSPIITGEGNPVFSTVLFLLVDALEIVLLSAAAPFLKRLRTPLSEGLPLRYHVTFCLMIVSTLFYLTLLPYYHSMKEPIPWGMVLFVVLMRAGGGIGAVVLTVDEDRARRALMQKRAVQKASDMLGEQLTYLKRQKGEIAKVQEAVNSYRKNADFAGSIDDLFEQRKAYIEGRYCEDPILNTLLMYYADTYARKGISSEFNIHMDGSVSYSPALRLNLYNSLLASACDHARLEIVSAKNAYSVRFETGEEAERELKKALASLQSLLEANAFMYHIRPVRDGIAVTLSYIV